MPRSRNIKPSLYKDVDLAELPIEARYMFPGLWCLADCEGRLVDSPKYIKAEIYPYDHKVSVARIHELLQLLADSGFIVRYQSGKNNYIQVVNFKKHQNPHKKEREKGSDIPGLDRVQTGSRPGNSGAEPGKVQPNPGNSGASRADSGFLIPDSGLPTAPEKSWAAPAPQSAVLTIEQHPAAEVSERMYAKHPKKKNRTLVIVALKMALDRGHDLGKIEACHEAWCATPEWRDKNGHFAPKLDEWIDDEGFRDWPKTVAMRAVSSSPPPPPTRDQQVKSLRELAADPDCSESDRAWALAEIAAIQHGDAA